MSAKQANLHVATFEQQMPRNFKNACWRLWCQCDTTPEGKAEIAALAAHRHVRERGGWHEDKPLKVFVFVSEKNPETYPVKVDYTEFNIHRM